jgi:branched-chain amino acid aminotransferase
MAAGTAASLVPIRSITMKSKGDVIQYMDESEQKPGPVCEKLLVTLKSIQQGKIKDSFGWLDAVPEPKGYKSRNADEGINGNGSLNGVNAL